MQSENPIFVSFCGVSTEDEFLLITVIKLLAHEGKIFKVIDNHSQSHLLVIDFDAESGKRDFKRSRDGQVKLLIGDRKYSGKNLISVIKPFEITSLKEIFANLHEKMFMQLELARKKSPRVGGLSRNSTHVLTDTVFHLLLSTKENKDHVCIGSEGYPDILVDGENKSITTTASTQDLDHIIRKPLFEHNVRKLKGTNLSNKEGKISPLYNVLWMSALSCSHGQLLPGHKSSEPVKLKAWPNFTRNGFKPEYFKLAAILAQRPVALSDLENLTQVPYAEIVNFYNAAYSVDLIEKNFDNMDAKVTERKVSAKKKSLLGKIADRLGFGLHKLNAVDA